MPEPPSDDPLYRTATLIHQFQAGDQDAFTHLYKLHHDRVLRSVARRLGRHLHDIIGPEDVLQETFTKVAAELKKRASDEFRSIGRFRNLLAKIAAQIVVDYGRMASTEGRDWRRKEALGDELSGFAANQPRPSEVAGAKELEYAMDTAFLELRPEDREVLDLRDLGFEYEEIANAMGLTNAATAKLRHSRAMARWRSKLGSAEGEQPM